MAAYVAEALAAAVVRREITAQMGSSSLARRQSAPPGFVEQDGEFIPFWFSRAGMIVKWSVFLGIFAIISLYLIVGYTHAQRRLRKGLLPLRYHRWLVSRAELARVDPARYGWQQPAGISPYGGYRPNGGGEMYGMAAMPPPVYDPNAPRPPVYSGPDGGSKVDPFQDPSRRGPAPEYEAPPGPPPPTNRTGVGAV